MGKSSQKTTISKVYGNTTTSNPYVSASTNNSGTVSNFVPGSALEQIYNHVNNNIGSLLDEYINPSLNSKTNQAKLNAFNNELSRSSYKNLENNIISPLSNRNMIRSSQATDLYKNLSASNANSLSSYVDKLLAESQENTASMLNNLLAAYLKGYDVISDTQKQSLNTSLGNATTTTNSNNSGLFGSSLNANNLTNILEKVFSAYSNVNM